jgi:hypothetical protein
VTAAATIFISPAAIFTNTGNGIYTRITVGFPEWDEPARLDHLAALRPQPRYFVVPAYCSSVTFSIHDLHAAHASRWISGVFMLLAAAAAAS